MRDTRSPFVIKHPEYDFKLDGLLDVFDPNFLRIITKIGNETLHKKAITTTRQYVTALNVYAEFHRVQQSPISSILSNGEFVTNNLAEWISDTVLFNDYLNTNCTASIRQKHITGMNFWWERMSSQMICPAGLRLKNEKVGHRGTKTLFDFRLTDEAESALSEMLGSDTTKGELTTEAHRMYQHICMTLGDVEPTMENIPILAQATLHKRLKDLRDDLQSVFDIARKTRVQGLIRVRNGRKHHLLLLDRWLAWRKGTGDGNRNPFSEAVRELSDDDFINAHLAWCVDRHELRGLSPKSEYTDTRIYNIFRKEISRRGIELDAKTYQSWLGASHEMLVSSYLLLVYDLTANPHSIANLDVNADYRLLNGLAGVDWEKRRSKKVLTLLDGIEVDGRTPPTKVVATVRKATKHYRKHCIPADRNQLFLLNYQNKTSAKGRKSSEPISRPSMNWFNTHAKALIAKTSNGEWVTTALALRASLLLLEGLKYGLSAANKKAQHSDTRTTTTYINKLPMRLQNDAKIRAFMEWLEALVAIDIEDFAEKVGLDPVEFEKRRQEVLGSQFGGLHCRDNTSGYQEGSEAGHPCTQVSKCMTCEKRRNLFVASEENMVHLIMWNDALVNAEKNGWIQRSADWLMWSAFIDSMCSRMQENARHRAVFAGARRLVDQLVENPYLSVFMKGKYKIGRIA